MIKYSILLISLSVTCCQLRAENAKPLSQEFFERGGFVESKKGKDGLEKIFTNEKSLSDFLKQIGVDYSKVPYSKKGNTMFGQTKVFRSRGFFFHVEEELDSNFQIKNFCLCVFDRDKYDNHSFPDK